MSGNNRAEQSESSGEEEQIVKAKTRHDRGKKAATRRRQQPNVDSGESDVEIPQPPKKTKKTTHSSIHPPLERENEVLWQAAMEKAVEFLHPLKVDLKPLTLLPDFGTLECFKKGVQQFLNEKKQHLQLSYTTQKTMLSMIARFFFSFIIKSCDLLTPGWDPTGCVIWEHGCSENELKCLHGLTMQTKEQVIQLDISTESAQKALKENQANAKLSTNRWGRECVEITNDDAACCPHDVNCPSGSHTSKSCGFFYTEAKKAKQGFAQIMAFQKAVYPNMNKVTKVLLMPIRCDCNWGSNLPLLGRQTCKVTPFAVNAVSTMDKSQIDDEKLLATIRYPVLLVFQCCNPVYRNTKANPQKNCDFKISSVDVVGALQVAKQIWKETFKTQPPITIQNFKWMPQYQYTSTILPMGEEDTDESLF
ncbi:DBP [Egyptian fruit bat adenovirus]|uniref:DNA-binding protein n=1 Tax=Egyptian fruit bat adenovirus TaxID=2849732 RepID=A0A344X9V3_9ADEN|nr:DBP [Rousettus aegyptiacus adenovirus]AXE75635.1 DBP [Egyptian fruit bat adenovirus]